MFPLFTVADTYTVFNWPQLLPIPLLKSVINLSRRPNYFQSHLFKTVKILVIFYVIELSSNLLISYHHPVLVFTNCNPFQFNLDFNLNQVSNISDDSHVHLKQFVKSTKTKKICGSFLLLLIPPRKRGIFYPSPRLRNQFTLRVLVENTEISLVVTDNSGKISLDR